jgi:hypothetical protein
MDHQRLYNSIIEKAKYRGLNKKSLSYYTERHHIIPRCLKGSNDKSNLVLLTGREHYLCHLLLIKIHPSNNKILFAIWRMIHGRQSSYIKMTSRQFEKIRCEHSKVQRNNIGPLSSNFGKKFSDESKERMRIAHLGKTITEETRTKLKASRKLRIFTDATKEKMRVSSIGKKHNDITKEKMRDAKLGTLRSEEIKKQIAFKMKEIWKQRKLNQFNKEVI